MDFDQNRQPLFLIWTGVSPAVKVLLGLHILVYVLQLVIGTAFTGAIALGTESLSEGRLWTMLSYMFGHGDLVFHFLFNLLLLMVLGSVLEREVGPKAFLAIYLLAGFLGGVVHLLFGGEAIVGSTGAIAGVVVALVALRPFDFLQIGMLPPMRVWFFGLWFAVVDLMYFLLDVSFQSSLVAYEVHLVGALTGLAFVLYYYRPSWAVSFFGWKGGRNEEDEEALMDYLDWQAQNFDSAHETQPGTGEVPGDSPPAHAGSPSEAEVNAVLDKLSKVGLANLSERERRVLEKAAEAKNQSP